MSLQRSLLLKGAGWLTKYELAFYLIIGPLLLFSSRFSVLGLVLIALLWVARWYIRGFATVRTSLDVPILVLLAMSVVSLFPSADLGVSWPKFLGIILGVAVYYAVVNGVRNKRDIRFLSHLLPVLGVLIAIVSLIGTNWTARKLFYLPQIVSLLPNLATLMPKSVLPAAQIGFHPNEVGGALAMILPIPIAMYLGTASIRRRWLYALAAVVMAFTLVMTQSRSALMGLGVAFLILATWKDRKFLLVLPALAILVLIWGRVQGFSGLGDFLFAIDQTTNRAYEGAVISRADIWARAVMMIQDFPYTGIGLNNFPFVFDTLYPSPILGPDARMPHAHNLYLQTAVDLGVIGLLAFLAMLAYFWALVVRAYRRIAEAEYQSILVGIAAGIVAYMVYGFTDTFTLGAKPGIAFWFMIAIVVSLYHQVAANDGLPTMKCKTSDAHTVSPDAESTVAKPPMPSPPAL